jgi:hypothetical protein
MNPRREKFYTRAAIFFVLLFIAYLSVPARAADSDITVVSEYPLEYCAAVTGLSSVILLGEGDAELGEKHASSLAWFLANDLNVDVLQLIELKLEDLVATGAVTAEDAVADGTVCHDAHIAYVASHEESSDE